MKKKLEKIVPSSTIVDYSYQRELDAKRVDDMAKAFDPNLIGVPVVSRRPDGVVVRIDGQHRIALLVAAGHGDDPIIMEVHEGLSDIEEARLYFRLNNERRAVGAIDKFKSRIKFKDPIALEIQLILKRNGCKITKSMQRGGVQAVQAIEWVYHRGNLDPVMQVLVAWLDSDPAAFDGMIIRAVSSFLTAVPSADPTHLSSRLEDYAPQKLVARLRREKQIVAGSQIEVARNVLCEVYNYRTPKSKKVSIQSGREPQEE